MNRHEFLKRTGFCAVAMISVLHALSAFAQSDSIELIARDEKGQPVEGARVVHSFSDHSYVRRSPLADSEWGLTDDEGRYVMRDLQGRTHYILVHTDTMGTYSRIDLPLDEPKHEVTLVRGRTIMGRVTSEDGHPLEGVSVNYRGVMPVAVTDENGAYSLPSLPVDHSTTFTFSKDGYGLVRENVRADRGKHFISLPRGSQIIGQVFTDTGEPAAQAEVLFTDHKAVTDAKGRFDLSWHAVGKGNTLQARLTTPEQEYVAKVQLIVKAKTNDVTLHLAEPPPLRTTYISGTIVMKETGEPVRAKLYTDTERTFYAPDRHGENAHDGTFLIEGINTELKKIYLYVFPVRATLYAPSARLYFNLSEGPFEDVVIKVQEGSAVRGRVIDHEGNGVPEAQILWKPWPFSRAIWANKNGHFIVPNLPLIDTPYELRVSAGKRRSTYPLGNLAAGELRKDVLIQTYSVPVAGYVSDQHGVPVQGAYLLLRTKDEIVSANTDDDGRFRLVAPQTGTAKFDVYIKQNIRIGSAEISHGPDIKITEGTSIDIFPAKPIAEHRITLHVTPRYVVRGIVKGADGAVIDHPSVRILGNRGRIFVRVLAKGGFLLCKLPQSGFAIEVTKHGYQAQVLLPSRDFQLNDQGVVVTLIPGPFRDDISIFEQVTGLRESPENIQQLPGGEEIVRSCQFMYPTQAKGKYIRVD